MSFNIDNLTNVELRRLGSLFFLMNRFGAILDEEIIEEIEEFRAGGSGKGRRRALKKPRAKVKPKTTQEQVVALQIHAKTSDTDSLAAHAKLFQVVAEKIKAKVSGSRTIKPKATNSEKISLKIRAILTETDSTKIKAMVSEEVILPFSS